MRMENAHVEAVRRFNRFYTRTIGLLPERHLHTPFSLVEVRVLYELAHRAKPTATAIASDLRLDLGYMSRIVARLEELRLLERKTSAADRRQSILRLTAKGKSTFAKLNQRAADDVGAVLDKLTPDRQALVTGAMQVIERVLGTDAPAVANAPTLRPPRPGDFGWVVQRHGEIYATEYGWNEEFEALVARIVADYIRDLEPAKERAWIAEHDGARVGSVFLVKKSTTVAKLRCLLVEPNARGLGIGRKLVSACTEFARHAGYRKIVLWTQSNLLAARRIYAAEGYRLIDSVPNHSFGHDLVAETWELRL